MPTLRVEILSSGGVAGVVEPVGDVVLIGRGAGNDVSVENGTASPRHARLTVGSESVLLEDLGSVHGTSVVRGTARLVLLERSEPLPVEHGDVVCFGVDEDRAEPGLRLHITADEDPEHIVELRPLDRLRTTRGPSEPERVSRLLATLHEAQQAIGEALGLKDALAAIADAALVVLPRATHATLILRDERAPAAAAEGAFLPVLSRVRGPDGRGMAPTGPVVATRSVFRKVVRERAAVFAADAPSEELSTESLLGASIRSTIGLPLWKGNELIGVLQVDNRDAPAMFDSSDVDVLAVLAVNASLAVANARLIERLVKAEEQLTSENRFLRSRDREHRGGSTEIVGNSEALSALMRQIDKVADTRATVLIEGETGVGKELVANAIHERSRRRDRLFVAQNCAALPETLLESELFGHKRGAFTGATEEKKGLFELADGGTLLLDEVTEMPLSLQAKLLRVLQEGEVRRLGALQPRYVDVRIVAATNKILEVEVAQGRFREDLYYRLRVFPLRVPPLRERREDIEALVRYFLERHSKELGKGIEGLAPETLELFSAYDWPGNIRELSNEVQRLVIQADAGQLIGPDSMSPRIRKAESAVTAAGVAKGSLRDMLDQVERHLILRTLEEHSNNKTSAAKALGITREGLHKKLRQLGIRT